MLAGVLEDLAEEQASLASVLAGLDAAQWDLPTPSAGWAVRDQVAHLALSEELATLATTDPEGFGRKLRDMLSDLEAVEQEQVTQAADRSPVELLAWWRNAAAVTLAAVRLRDGERIGWVTGPMSATSFATARLMETWAHGHDIDEAVGRVRDATRRLRHVADLGVRTRGFSFANRGLAVPPAEPRVELRGPGGEQWTWGPADAAEKVAGDALDFCLVVTQRAKAADTDLTIVGSGATAWMSIAQCFAGPPT